MRSKFNGGAGWRSLMLSLLTLLALTVASRPARAQALTIGVVDEDRLAEGYKLYRDAVSKLEQRAQGLDKQLSARELLSDVEGRRFDDLILKERRSVVEENELQTLIKTGDGRRADYISLVGTAERTADQNTRMKSLEADAARNAAAIQRTQDTLYNNIKKVQDETDKEYTDRANKVIELVAGDKKLSLVVRKRAVVWNAAAIDITDEVLTRLNK